MDIRKVVARNVRRLRVAKELSQESLAVDAEVDRTHVSRIERGIENPTILVLARLADALDADVVEFFRPPKPGERAPDILPKGRKARSR